MKHFISFTYQNYDKVEFNWVVLNIDDVETETDVERLQRRVKEELQIDGISILSWRKL